MSSLIISQPDDQLFSALKLKSTSQAERIKTYSYYDFGFSSDNSLLHQNKPFKFHRGDKVLFRFTRDFSPSTAYLIRALSSLAVMAGAKVVDLPIWSDFPHFQDKLTQAALFAAASIPHVPTLNFDKYNKSQTFSSYQMSDICRQFRFPLLIKPRLGTEGRGTKIIKNSKELSAAKGKLTPLSDYLVQPFRTLRRDVRVLIIGGRLLGAVRRQFRLHPDGHIGVKVSRKTRLTPTETELVHRLRRLLNQRLISMCGIDILTDDTGYSWVTELNFAPNFAGFSRVTGLNAAEEFLSFLRIISRGTISP